jgi:hypothetical protein
MNILPYTLLHPSTPSTIIKSTSYQFRFIPHSLPFIEIGCFRVRWRSMEKLGDE